MLADLEHDVKLDDDRRSERLILGKLRERSDIDFLSEERGFEAGTGNGSGWRWIVDPLDGTVNYWRGIPLCCVSVGLWWRNEPVLGAIYDFCRDELFTGIAGVAAWINGTPIRVSTTSDTRRAVLCTGFPVSMQLSASAVASFLRTVQSYRKVRILGSAALSLAHVAAGRADAYCERDIKLWDVGAGLAIVAGAGGRIEHRRSKGPDTLVVHATNGSLPSHRGGRRRSLHSL